MSFRSCESHDGRVYSILKISSEIIRKQACQAVKTAKDGQLCDGLTASFKADTPGIATLRHHCRWYPTIHLHKAIPKVANDGTMKSFKHLYRLHEVSYTSMLFKGLSWGSRFFFIHIAITMDSQDLSVEKATWIDAETTILDMTQNTCLFMDMRAWIAFFTLDMPSWRGSTEVLEANSKKVRWPMIGRRRGLSSSGIIFVQSQPIHIYQADVDSLMPSWLEYVLIYCQEEIIIILGSLFIYIIFVMLRLKWDGWDVALWGWEGRVVA